MSVLPQLQIVLRMLAVFCVAFCVPLSVAAMVGPDPGAGVTHGNGADPSSAVFALDARSADSVSADSVSVESVSSVAQRLGDSDIGDTTPLSGGSSNSGEERNDSGEERNGGDTELETEVEDDALTPFSVSAERYDDLESNLPRSSVEFRLDPLPLGTPERPPRR